MNKETWLNWPLAFRWCWQRKYWAWFKAHGVQCGWSGVGHGVFYWVYTIGPFQIQFGSEHSKVISCKEHDTYSLQMQEYHEGQLRQLRNGHESSMQSLIASHRKCHEQFSQMIDKQQELTVAAYKRFEEYVSELKKKDRTVEADRVLEMADSLLWALEGRVGNFYFDRRSNELAAKTLH